MRGADVPASSHRDPTHDIAWLHFDHLARGDISRLREQRKPAGRVRSKPSPVDDAGAAGCRGRIVWRVRVAPGDRSVFHRRTRRVLGRCIEVNHVAGVDHIFLDRQCDARDRVCRDHVLLRRRHTFGFGGDRDGAGLERAHIAEPINGRDSGRATPPGHRHPGTRTAVSVHTIGAVPDRHANVQMPRVWHDIDLAQGGPRDEHGNIERNWRFVPHRCRRGRERPGLKCRHLAVLK